MRRYCEAAGWLHGIISVQFLAAGEYNQNWLVRAAQGAFVFRINHGSQLGLGDTQIAYEYRVLDLLRESGVTPVPLAVDAQPWNVEPELGGGVLLMTYLPGGPLDYRRDAGVAAAIFAAVHACSMPQQAQRMSEAGLIVQADPVGDIVRESDGLLTRFPDHPRQDVLQRLLRYRDEVARLGEETLHLFADEPLIIVNTEVNSGNFLIERDSDGAVTSSALVDWEKAVISCRHQDLGHFLARTTTLWKTDYTFDAPARSAFLDAYAAAIGERGVTLDRQQLDEATRVMERTILLRGLSWCAMAWHEYTRDNNTGKTRALRHDDTFATMERYLDSLEWLLR